jgi:hypothetical protein
MFIPDASDISIGAGNPNLKVFGSSDAYRNNVVKNEEIREMDAVFL